MVNDTNIRNRPHHAVAKSVKPYSQWYGKSLATMPPQSRMPVRLLAFAYHLQSHGKKNGNYRINT